MFFCFFCCCFFFFQAEDGIRDIGVTGVQTCALPILQTNFIILKSLRLKESGTKLALFKEEKIFAKHFFYSLGTDLCKFQDSSESPLR